MLPLELTLPRRCGTATHQCKDQRRGYHARSFSPLKGNHMLRRFVVFAVLTLALAACGGGDDAQTASGTAPASGAPTTAAATEAPTSAASETPPTQPPGGGGFTGVPGVPVAEPDEHPLPDSFPYPEYPVPGGGTFEVLDDSETYTSLRIDYEADMDPAALLAFFEEGFPANGCEPTEQHSNTDQFGYYNENRQFSKDDLSATVTVWFPQEEADPPYVVLDLFRS